MAKRARLACGASGFFGHDVSRTVFRSLQGLARALQRLELNLTTFWQRPGYSGQLGSLPQEGGWGQVAAIFFSSSG